MAGNQLHNQELTRHEEVVDRNLAFREAVSVDEQQRGIAAANQNSSVARIVNIIYFLLAALQVLLLVRVVLQLIGVNPANSFANFVYTASAPFVALFESLVQNPSVGGASVLEITTFIAMVAWAIAGWLLGRLIWLALSRPR